jgi:hypothetical protein
VGRTHSYAAYAPDDVTDAKRGHPEVSLQPWATARGLEYMGSTLPGAFSPVMPIWQDYVFNLCRGTFAPGRYGYVAHELDEVGLDDKGGPRQTGGYFAVHVNQDVGGLRGILRFAAHLEDKRPNEPFAARAFWLPTTTVAIRVPEAALLPVVCIRSSERLPPLGNPALDDVGLPGFRMAGSQWVDDRMRAAIGRAAGPLAALGAAYARLRLDRGVVAVTRNGFVDPAALDQMVAIALAVAEGVAHVAHPMTAPAPFSTPLPMPQPETWPPGYDRPQDHEVDVLGRVSAELAMVQEDPVAFHRAHPSCPVPGRALGVVRGVLPGTAIEGRVGFFVQGGHTSGTYRSAVMVPAATGGTTPLGGALDRPSDLYVEVADGVAHAWPRVRSVGALNAGATVAAATEALTRLGLVGPAPR